MEKDLRSLNLLEMQDLMKEIKEPLFRAKQLSEWIHKKGIGTFSEITNFNKELRETLATKTKIASLKLIKSQVSHDDTRKYLFQLEDDHYLECVLMRYRGTKSKQRNTLCVSSQVGCAMGCGFCATGQGGFHRNLTPGEILSQVYTINNFLYEEDAERVGTVVYMGMGEPLLNYDNVLKSIRLLNEPYGQNISRRRITISTCGIVPKIISLADLKLDIVLAVSLHAPSDELRSQIMPVNLQYPLTKLKEACLYYIGKTQRRITFEYALVKDFNDTKEHALQLACFLKGLLCHINLIPVNPTTAKTYQRPAKAKLQNFLDVLTRSGIEATIREEKGTDILAACGQLRGKVVE